METTSATGADVAAPKHVALGLDREQLLELYDTMLQRRTPAQKMWVLKGQDAVAIAYLGEGSTSQGDFHEALNWAGVHKLPCIFVVENNKYAITEPQEKQMAIRDVADRAAGYGLPGVVVDGNDVLAVYEVTKEAARHARAGEGATLIEAKTYRLVPHSSDDNDRRYRTAEEVDEWRH